MNMIICYLYFTMSNECSSLCFDHFSLVARKNDHHVIVGNSNCSISGPKIKMKLVFSLFVCMDFNFIDKLIIGLLVAIC